MNDVSNPARTPADNPVSAADLSAFDAIIVGSGPNGLAAAIRLAQAGRSVCVLEAASTPGGGVRSAELTLPGFIHDVCSSVYPMAACSPFLRTLPLAKHGLQWITPPIALAHPLDDLSAQQSPSQQSSSQQSRAAVLHNSLDDTVADLGPDGPAYRNLVGQFVASSQDFFADALSQPGIPHHPLMMANFGLRALRSAASLARATFKTERARGLFAGIAAHSILPLEMAGTSAPALVLAIAAHVAGWPIARGGSQQLANAMVSHLESLGGKVITNCMVESLDQLNPQTQFQPGKDKLILFDVTPRQLIKITGSAMPASFKLSLNKFKHGMAVYKVDWALKEPVPWRSKQCRLAGTIHLGATLDEICASERRAWNSQPPERPYVLFAQPSLFDPTRAPAGHHTAWAYCHVPYGYTGNATQMIEDQIERFAPGFKDCILARSVMGPADLEAHNPNLIGGDIGGGAATLKQLLVRPTTRLWRTPMSNIYLCSSSTPPGPGVHGMCGYQAAEKALADHS
jgi:phytoene dehydrogenase-like protein